MSNKWLTGLAEDKYFAHDYQNAASAYGYTYIQTEVSDIDRDERRIVTQQGMLDYDWLILAVGIRYDYEAWYGNHRRAAEHTLKNYPCAYIPGSEQRALKEKLDNFKGGDLLMTLPPMPYRCPPSPYERACMIGAMLKSRKIKDKLIILDPNSQVLGFSRVFSEHYPEQIVYLRDQGVSDRILNLMLEQRNKLASNTPPPESQQQPGGQPPAAPQPSTCPHACAHCGGPLVTYLEAYRPLSTLHIIP